MTLTVFRLAERRDEFWMAGWAIDRHLSMKHPRLWGHRYLPAEPLEAGNPVLSGVRPTDIVYCGVDLGCLLAREFGLAARKEGIGPHGPRRIRFWSDITDAEDEGVLPRG